MFIQVQVTTPNAEVAHDLADAVLEMQLAACVQIVGPIISKYRYEGKRNNDPEYLILMKTKKNLFDEITEYVKARHPYDVPQIIALDIAVGSESYLSWIDQSVLDQ